MVVQQPDGLTREQRSSLLTILMFSAAARPKSEKKHAQRLARLLTHVREVVPGQRLRGGVVLPDDRGAARALARHGVSDAGVGPGLGHVGILPVERRGC